jgi:predicted amidophosphoribosyltransferase
MSTPWFRRLGDAGIGLLTGLRHLVYPGCCLLCGRPLPDGTGHFCAACQHDLFTDALPCCPRCAGSVGPFAVIAGRCRACREEPFAFEQVVRLGPYEGLLREVILRLKHQSGEGTAELLGECWAERAIAPFETLQVDAIVPIPLHWLR